MQKETPLRSVRVARLLKVDEVAVGEVEVIDGARQQLAILRRPPRRFARLVVVHKFRPPSNVESRQRIIRQGDASDALAVEQRAVGGGRNISVYVPGFLPPARQVVRIGRSEAQPERHLRDIGGGARLFDEQQRAVRVIDVVG